MNKIPGFLKGSRCIAKWFYPTFTISTIIVCIILFQQIDHTISYLLNSVKIDYYRTFPIIFGISFGLSFLDLAFSNKKAEY